MTTRIDKAHRLLDTLGFDEAIKIIPALTDDSDGEDEASKAAARDAAKAAELAKAQSANPFVKGPNFSLKEQGRLYRNPKTRALAIGLAKSAGVKLPDMPTHFDLNAEGQRVA